MMVRLAIKRRMLELRVAKQEIMVLEIAKFKRLTIYAVDLCSE